MNSQIPPSVAAYFQASNAHDTEAVVAPFTENAIIADEGHEHRGADEIRAWSNKVVAAYRPSAEIIDSQAAPEGCAVTARVSGTFPGSPIEIRYHFTLQGDKIAALRIEA